VLFQRIAQAPHIVERNQVIVRAEGAEHWAGQGGNDCSNGLAEAELRPIRARPRRVPHDHGRNFRFRGEDQRMAPRLAIAATATFFNPLPDGLPARVIAAFSSTTDSGSVRS